MPEIPFKLTRTNIMPIKVIHIKPEFKDARGIISRIVDDDSLHFRAVLYITSRKGTTRGDHYHKKDFHYVYCLSGKFKYSEKAMSESDSKVESVILKPGDLVLSRPTIAHKMEFLEDSTFLAITTEPREHERYEKDTVRIKLT